jgi:peptidoglycan/LPS O-acetylase OafA/YrhL
MAAPSPAERIPEIDALRFAAATAVVLYHFTYRAAFAELSTVTRYGYLGVPLFFMLSGFVILWSSEHRTVREFAVSRVSRLYPSFWLAVALTTAVVAAASRGSVTLREFVANLTMVPNLAGVPYLDTVYWTLFVELKFYLLIGLVLLTGTMPRIERWILALLAAHLACAAGIAPHAVGALTMFPLGAYFASGCLAFLVRSRGVTPVRIGALAVSAGLSVADAVRTSGGFLSDHLAADPVVVPLAVVLCHVVLLAIALRVPLVRPSRRWYVLGSLTYPLYLLHNRIGKVMRDELVARGWSELAALLAMLLVAYGLASIFAALIERRVCGAVQRRLNGTRVASAAVLATGSTYP